MKDLISNCFLCGEKSLHVAGTEEAQVMQCINCGYVTSTKFNSPKKSNEEFQKLSEDMKNWSIEKNGKIWIPTIITLPIGMLYPINENDKMKWSLAFMVEIQEEDRENFPNPNGGFYEKRIDTENAKVFDNFIDAMVKLNEKAKQGLGNGG
tara:strand:- start:596 stop:1048 length:453 start_codon:yes stop_codon:yes gene_type:complete